MNMTIERRDKNVKKKPPPRPRRVSSARADTVNPPLDDGNVDLEDSCTRTNNSGINGSIVTSESMGSSSSINRDPPTFNETFPGNNNNLLTLSHAPVHNGDHHSDDFDAKSHSTTSEKELDTVHRSPMKAVHFKQSTFKGSSMSALTLSRNHLEKSSSPLMNSIFPQKGKYKFYDSDDGVLTSDLSKSSTVRPTSSKLHQSEPPDLAVSFTSQSPIMMSEAAQKTAMTYGTLRKTNTTGSVTELFQKSKSKVRNSLRNWRFYNKTEKTETSSEANQEVLVRRPELYDVTMTKPDDYDETARDWLSSSQDSASFYRRKVPMKTVLPVKVPSLSREHSMKARVFCQQDGSREQDHVKPYLGARRSLPDDLSTDPISTSQSANYGSEISMQRDNCERKTPEQESIEMLDSVIKIHAQSRHSTATSLSDAPSVQIPPPFDPELPVFASAEENEPRKLQRCQSDESFAAYQDEADSFLYQTNSGSNKQSSRTVPKNQSADSLLIPTSDPKALYSPFGSALIQSIKPTPSTTPELPGRGSPIFIPGLSVTDVLNQEYSSRNPGSKAASSCESPRRKCSANSYATSEMNSFGESSNSQDFINSDGDDLEEIVQNGGNIRKSGWLYLKPLLVVRKGKLDRSSKRKWQKYWVNLKGDQLLFYEVSEVTMLHESEKPSLILPVDGALVQAMPEHATKSNVMCMSTSHGTAYLLQAQRQIEVNTWIYSLHIEAASSLARSKRDDPSNMTKRFIHTVLQNDLDRMKKDIMEDEKMRKMAELQNSFVSDSKTHRTITNQINSWDENAERNHVHSFRLRCYLASLNTAEPPNPQSAIAAARKTSKQLLSTFKCFNIATLHCLVVSKQLYESSSRKRGLSLNLKRSGSFNEVIKDGSQSERSGLPKQKKNLLGSLRGFDTWKGSTSSGGKKKTFQRSPMTGILTALTSSSSGYSSGKNSDEKLKTPSGVQITNGGWPVLPPPSGEYDSANERTLDTPSEDEILDGHDSFNGSLDSLLLSPPDAWCMPVELQSSSIRVTIATNNFVTVTLTQNMNFQQLLEIVCQRKQLDSTNFYLVIGEDEVEVKGNGLVSEVNGQSVMIRKKKQYCAELEPQSGDYGLTFKKPKALCCCLVVENVSPGGPAELCGINSGEEILLINGELTADLEDEGVAMAMKADHLRLLVQTTKYDPESETKTWWLESEDSAGDRNSWSGEDREKARINHLMAVMEEYLKKIVVPPPPIVSKQQSGLGKRHDSAEDILSALVIPPPDGSSEPGDTEKPMSSGLSSERCDELIQELLKKAETVTKLCKLLRSLSSPSLLNEKSEKQVVQDGSELPQHLLNDIEKIWKVLEELVETETNYVKDLDCLLNRFLEPLHSEGFLASPAMESLLQSVKNILTFQQTFLKDLSHSFSKSMNRCDLPTLNHSLVSVTSTFLQHAAQFKLYAVFSTCHSVAQDLIMESKSSSSDVRTFLEARNPKQQHSLSLDSYLIKPIQRVLKYPLLLRELLTFSESLDVIETKTKRRLKAALHTMHAVARHINDSQTVHDEFGMQGFQEIMEQSALMALGSMEIAASLTLTNLLCYCTTEWQNAPSDVVLRKKKGNFLEMLVLVFRSSVVLLCRSTKQREKKRPGIPQMDSFSSYGQATTTDFIFTDVIPGPNVSVEPKCSGFKYGLELSSNDLDIEPRTYRLLCSSSESKQRIVKTVRYVMKDSLRIQINIGDPEQDYQDTSENLTTGSIDDVFTPKSISSCRSTPTLKQRFFYQPPKQSTPDNMTSSSDSNPFQNQTPATSSGPRNLIPMTLPLPTYKPAENVVQSSPSLIGSERLCRRSTDSTGSTRSKSSNRRSGLYITMAPSSQKLSENSFRLLLPHNQSEECEKTETKSTENSNLQENAADRDSLYSNDDSDSFSSSDALKKASSVPNLPKHSSPARYQVSYGVSSFESDL